VGVNVNVGPPGVTVLVGVLVGVLVRVLVGVLVDVGLLTGGSFVILGVTVGVRGVHVGSTKTVLVAVAVGVCVRVAVSVRVGVGVRMGVGVYLGVCVGVGGDWVGVPGPCWVDC
jgi:hypothetical protein